MASSNGNGKHHKGVEPARAPEEVAAAKKVLEEVCGEVVPQAQAVSAELMNEEADSERMPTSKEEVGLLTPGRARMISETGIIPPARGATRRMRAGSKYLTEMVRIMLGWPMPLVEAIYEDSSQPTGARIAASQVILAYKGVESATDRMFERTEGRAPADMPTWSGPDQLGTGGSGVDGAGPKKPSTAEALEAAFEAAMEARGRLTPGGGK